MRRFLTKSCHILTQSLTECLGERILCKKGIHVYHFLGDLHPFCTECFNNKDATETYELSFGYCSVLYSTVHV